MIETEIRQSSAAGPWQTGIPPMDGSIFLGYYFEAEDLVLVRYNKLTRSPWEVAMLGGQLREGAHFWLKEPPDKWANIAPLPTSAEEDQ